MCIVISDHNFCTLCSERAVRFHNTSFAATHSDTPSMKPYGPMLDVFAAPCDTRAFTVSPRCVYARYNNAQPVSERAATHCSPPESSANGTSLCQWPAPACANLNTPSKALQTQCLADLRACVQEIKRSSWARNRSVGAEIRVAVAPKNGLVFEPEKKGLVSEPQSLKRIVYIND